MSYFYNLKNMNKKIIDVSLSIYPGMVNYPKNPEIRFSGRSTGATYLTELALGTHTGTHMDAPRHVSENGLSVDDIGLDVLVGECRVLDCSGAEGAVMVKDLEEFGIKKGERVLLKTSNSARGFEEFYDDYVYLDGDAAEYLRDVGVKLVGIDYLSIKQKGSDDTRAHDELLNNGIVIIEGVDLSEVSGGEYELIAMPLKLRGLDGAPCRVGLREG